MTARLSALHQMKNAGSLHCSVVGVISQVADPARAARAMAAVDEHLVRRGDGLVLLFEPPFDRDLARTRLHQRYPPGIRENGGQYTHGAIWSAIAFAMLGDGDKAAEVFLHVEPD